MYGLKYTCTFDPIEDLSDVPVYKIEILEKGYTGEIFSIKGSTVPVLHQWETDDPKAPIKGSSLTMAFINDGSLPLSSFFSTYDDTFKVRLSYLTQVLFEGFLVQDDCSEPLLDFTHEINLSANDNLGLLKDVSLDRANIFSLTYTSDTLPMGADFNNRQFLFGVAVNANVGDKIRISGTGIVDGDFTINKLLQVPVTSGITTGVWVDEPLADNYAGDAVYSILTPANLLDKTPLSTILRMCLSVTSLELNTNVYGKIIEVSQDADVGFLEQTLIDPQTFLKSDTEFTDCYDVLTKILSRFNMTLFQANGVWNIVRWDELRYYDNLIEGFSYDKDFNATGTVTLSAPVISGKDEDTKAETGLLQKISRPFLYSKETFNYQYPRQLLRNFDLKQLGTLIRTYTKTVWVKNGETYDTDPGGFGVTVGHQITNEYTFKWWELNPPSVGEFFIRVITDDLENEIDRYAVVKTRGNNFYGSPDVKSFPIEANKGDSFIYSLTFKTTDSQSPAGDASNGNYQFYVSLYDGNSTKYFHNPEYTTGNNLWQSGPAFLFKVESVGNSNEWHTVSIDCSRYPIPADGLLNVYLTGADRYTPINETQYKDIRFEYAARINQSTKIIGQTHKNNQAGIIKNTEDLEIYIDSSPRNSIAGTLFLDEKEGVLQKRTSKWKHPYLTQSKNLGDIITYEQLFWRNKPRSILEGTLYGLINSGSHISLLSVLKYTYLNNLNFVFGRLEIDYKNNKLDGTIWEIWQDEESNVAFNYDFEYLYSTE